MLCNKQTKRNLTILLMAAAVLASGLALTAWAKKPDNPGGGKPGGGDDGSVGTGTIYYSSDGYYRSMNPDGTGKTPLLAWADYEVGGDWSMTRHPAGGDRWYLQVNEIPGFYPITTFPPEYWWSVSGQDDLEAVGFTGDPEPDLAWGTIIYYIQIDGEGDPDTFKWYANSSLLWGSDTSVVTGVPITGGDQDLVYGSTCLTIKFGSTTGHNLNDWWGIYVKKTQRHELFAVREDGLVEVQLTDDPDVQPWMPGDPSRALPRWATREGVVDGKVSYLAQRWEGEVVVEGSEGLYAVEIAWTDGTPSALTNPTILPVSVPIYDYDWSPVGNSIVFHSADGIRVADAYVEGSDEWLCDGYGPRWSPDGTLIAFAVAGKEIRTISPNGGPPTMVVALGKNRRIWSGRIFWSPMGTHLVYTRIQSKACSGCQYNDSYDVYRVGADGSDSTNLTKDLQENAFVMGWRD